jgi:uncharacterized membrane protein YphA (DoxX/SURF4 family)
MKTNVRDYWCWLRLAIAFVWLYQGGWLKLIAVDSHHLSIVEAAAPFGPPRLWIGAIGAFECLLAVWFLLGWRLCWCAWTQVALLAVMNTGGILSAGSEIPDPVGLVLMNVVFALSILGAGGVWRVARE